MTRTSSCPRRHSRLGRLLAPLLSLSLLGPAATVSFAGEFTNHNGMRFVDVPAGSFLMGSCKITDAMQDENQKRSFLGLKPLTPDCSNPDPNAQDNETPQHAVRLTAFQMGRTEVTLAQFKAYIAATGRIGMINLKYMKANAYGDDAPAVWVGWQDAQAFINWLNKTKPASDRGVYRLPSESEWEYACRAGGKHDYCGSNNANAVGWYYENGGWHPRPVAGKQANALGLHDMSGNVDEWVQDCYHSDYTGAPTDGSVWSSECNTTGHVLRGSSWKHYDAKYTRAAYRSYGHATLVNALVGFRVARSLPTANPAEGRGSDKMK
jgi:formylglycine-generating enzyme required for sulfatase activity